MFVCTAVGAPEAAALARLGLVEGLPNTHPRQGTACRRFFFHNAYLELLWVSNPEEAQSEVARPTHLWERWSGRGTAACPFALIFRGTEGVAAPFDTWTYRPAYLPAGMAIDVATGTALTEPELFYLRSGRRPDAVGQQPLDHGLPLREISRVEIRTPHGPRSAAARSAEAQGLVVFRESDEHVLEIGFDGETAGGRADLRPELPLVLRW